MSLIPQTPDTVSLAFVGDILLDRGVKSFVQEHGTDSLFTSESDSAFNNADFVIANLECPATEIGNPVFKKFMFNADPTLLGDLKRHAITHLNLANNHSLDMGRDGILKTIENVEKAGMKPFGAGKNMDEASTPLLLSNFPRKVFLIASCQLTLESFPYLSDKPSVAQLTINQICDMTKQLKLENPGCAVIVCLHWGVEHTSTPTISQRHDAHKIILAGADAIVGNHTHTLQTIETFKGKPIFYSLGNFIFDLPNEINRKTAIVIMKIAKDSISWEVINTRNVM